MLEQFLKFIKKEKLFTEGGNILLAVSGGMDSAVMCRLFHLAKINFGIAHCNFQLRGRESNGDEKFVEGLSKKYKVPFHVKKFDTIDFAVKNKVSIQMAARELRYSFFEEVRKKSGYEFVATAHHQTDVMETMLLNLTRGTGISGLHGILPKRGRIIRPMLFATRDDVEEFAQKNKIQFREDTSNKSEKYQRNLIRKKVVPALKRINPSVESAFNESAKRLRGVEKLLLDFTDEFRKNQILIKEDSLMIPVNAIAAVEYGEAILFELLRPFAFSPHVIENIFESSASSPGKMFFSESHSLTRDRKYFIITPLKAVQDEETFIVKRLPAEIVFDGKVFSFSLERGKTFKVPCTSLISCLDYDALKFPLTLRHWKAGDRFQPLGLKGEKKVSDYLVDIKMPRSEKNNVAVCLSGDKIISLPTLRIDERFKVTGKTKTILIIREEKIC
jgi:tRNA(Ile)-lysidine synthase